MSHYGIIENIYKRASRIPRRIIFPDATDVRTLRAVAIVSKAGIACPVLVGDRKEVQASARELGVSLSGVEICEPDATSKDRYAAEQLEKWRSQGTTVIEARSRLEDPVYFGASMVHAGDADGLVGAGSQSDFKRAVLLCIGCEPGSTTVSRYFLMALPSPRDGEGIVFADSGETDSPSGSRLASIAVAAAGSTLRLLGQKPRLAFLSFSPVASLDFKNRFQSAEADLHDRVRRALVTLRARGGELIADGELRTTIGFAGDGEAPAESASNTFVFPDTEAGNLGHRLAQRVDGARVVGPIFQGLARPANSLPSRYSVEDIVELTAITAVDAGSD